MDNLKLRHPQNIIYGWKFCENCNEYCQHSNYIAREWEYLLSLPLFPKGPLLHVLYECQKCKTRLFFYEKYLPSTVEQASKEIEDAVDALSSGKNQLKTNENENISSCSTILSAWSYFLCCIGNNIIVNNLLKTLEEKSLSAMSCLIKGRLLDFEGKLKEAIKLYEQTIKDEPNDEGAYIFLSQAYLGTKELEKSRDVYEKLLQLTENRVDALLELLDIYIELEDNVKVIETYERCFKEDPKLKKDRKFLKEYKKFCKMNNEGIEGFHY